MSKKIVCFLTLVGLYFLAPELAAAGRVVTLEWYPNTETNLAGYKVYWGLASQSYGWSEAVSAPATTLALTNLSGNWEYFFAITAVNTDGLESDYSDELSLLVTNKDNSAPVAISDSAIGAQGRSLPISLSAADFEGDSLEFVLLSSPLHGTLSGVSPNLTYTPDPDFNGSDSFLFLANDGLLDSEPANFSLVLLPVNDLPTLDPISGLTIKEDSGLTVVNLTGITSGSSSEAQKVTITAISANPSLIPTPTVTYISPRNTGTLTFAPAPDAWGTASITVIVSNGGNAVTREFTVTVNAVNDRPTINLIPSLSVDEDSGPTVINLSGISSGANNELQALTVAAISGNQSIIPNPRISYLSPENTATLTFTPAPDAWGSVPMGVIVNDGVSTVTRVFIVTVKPINDSPTLALIPNVTVNEDSGPTVVDLSGISSGAPNEVQTLTLTAVSSDTTLVPNPIVSYVSPASTAALAFTPVAHRSGVATITVTVNDGENARSRSFNVDIRPANRAPIVNAGPDQTVRMPLAVTFSGSVSDETSPGSSATLTVSWSAISGPGSVTFGSSNDLSTTASFSAPGQYVLQLMANDGELFATDEVSVEVLPLGPPAISDLVVVGMDARTIAVSLRTDRPTLCSVEYALDPSLSTMAAEEAFSTNHLIQLTNLEPATNYFVRVRSQDAEGHGSITGTMTVSTPSIAFVALSADAGVLVEPMKVGSNAVNMRFVWSPDFDAGSISFDVPIEVSSQYGLWCRVCTFGDDVGSFYVSNDSNADILARVGSLEWQQGWRWVRIDEARDLVNFRRWQPLLVPGLHHFVFRAHEVPALLSDVILSNDPNWVP